MGDHEDTVTLTGAEREEHRCRHVRGGHVSQSEHYHREEVESIVAARVAEALAPIEALADKWEHESPIPPAPWYVRELRAALVAPDPTPTTTSTGATP